MPEKPRQASVPPTRSDATPPLSHGRSIAALTALSVTAFVFVTSEILPFGLIALMAKDLGRTESEVGLVVTAHALGVVVASIPLAHATRHIPRRWLLPGVLGVFMVGTMLVAISSSFTALIVGRLLTACAHAAFWAVVNATAVGLFPPEVRGRTVARLLIGPSMAGVVGLPAATWLGQRAGWSVPFIVLAVAGALMAVALAILIPHYRPTEGAAARGSHPSVRKFVNVLGIALLAIVGANVTFTYITPYLRDVTGLSEGIIPVILFAGGLTGLAGMLTAARIIDHHPRGALTLALILVAIGWGGMAAAGSVEALSVTAYCLGGFGSSILVGSFANRVMQVSPGSTDLGIAIYGTVYNAGVALGSRLGKAVLDDAGASVLPLVSAGFIVAALALYLGEPRLTRSRRH